MGVIQAVGVVGGEGGREMGESDIQGGILFLKISCDVTAAWVRGTIAFSKAKENR